MKAETEAFLVQLEPPLGWITINRPAARNALTASMWSELAQLIQAFVDDENVRVLILRGAGEKSFISGADIADLQAQLLQDTSPDEPYQFTGQVLDVISQAPKPVVAMINGHCLGGGLLIALTCDLRLASTSANFGIPATKLGVAYPPEHGVTRLVHTVGAAHATELLLTGNTLSAEEAWRIGLVHQLIPAADLVEFTRNYALTLAQNAPLALAAHKLALHQVMQQVPVSATVVAAVNRCYHSRDCQEGLAAFLAKRPPHFTGQ